MIYDLAIVGGGPAGAAAAVYAARKHLKSVMVTADFGGQSTVSPDVQNWIGTVSIPGNELAEKLKQHVLAYQGDMLTVKEGEKATTISKSDNGFLVKTDKGSDYSAKSIILVTGARRRKLTVPGADTFEQKGITYCATCDGPLFAGKDVVVIGGGNAGFETAAQLLAYTKSVTLIHRGQDFKADAITVEKVLKNPKMRAVKNAETLEIKGGKFVQSLVYRESDTGEQKEIATGGVFVEIGFLPNTEFLGDLVAKNEYGSIMVDPRNQRSSVAGIWAAGDCADGLFHQNNIAAGDAIKAIEDIYLYLHREAI